MVLACLAVLAYGLGRERPHLVLIVVDSLRADARSDSVGAAATPNLDALARDGHVFHEAFAHSPARRKVAMVVSTRRERSRRATSASTGCT